MNDNWCGREFSWSKIRFITASVASLSVASALLLLSGTTMLPAASLTWTGAGDNSSWHNPTNWSGSIAPAAGDDVTIDLAGASVQFTQGVVTVRSITASRPLTISGGTLNVTSNFNFNSTTLTLSGGTLAVTNSLVSSGTVLMQAGQVLGQLAAYNGNVSFPSNSTATGTLLSYGNNNLIGEVPAGMTLWVQGNNVYGSAALAVNSNAVNHGTILLETTTSGGYQSTLNISAGATLVNASGAIIQANVGVSGTRSITGRLRNVGQIIVQPGKTMDFSGTLEAAGGTYNGQLFVQSTELIVSAEPSAPTSLLLFGANNRLASDNYAGLTLWVQGNNLVGQGALTVVSNAMNHGSILLETTTAGAYTSDLYVNPGVSFVNASDGLLRANTGVSGTRSLSGSIENRGTLWVETNVTLNVQANGSANVFKQTSGVIHADGELRKEGGEFQFSGGRLEGLVRANNAFVAVASTVNEISTLRITGTSGVLASNGSPAVTLWIEGNNMQGYASLTVTNTAINHGTIRLETTTSGGYSSYLSVNPGALLINASDGVLRANFGMGGTPYLQGNLENRGTLWIETNVMFSVQPNGTTNVFKQTSGVIHADGEFRKESGEFDFYGGRLEGLVRANNAVVAVADSVSEISTLRLTGSSFLASNASPFITLWIEANNSQGYATLTVTNTASNRGTILLQASSAGGYSSTLSVNAGGLFVNETNGIIRAANQGFGGAPHSLSGNVLNRGLLSVGTNAALNANGSGQFENWGTIFVESNAVASLGDTQSRFWLRGGLIHADGEFRWNSGAFAFDGGVLQGLVRANNAFVAVADGMNEISTLRLTGSGFLASNASPFITLWVEANNSQGYATLAVTNMALNRGTILLQGTSAGGFSSTLSVNAGGLFVNETNGVIRAANRGFGGTHALTGNVLNRGLLSVETNATLSAGASGQFENWGMIFVENNAVASLGDTQSRFWLRGGVVHADGEFRWNYGTFDFDGGMLQGLVRANNAFIKVSNTVTTASTLHVTGSGVLGRSDSPTTTLSIEGDNVTGHANLLITNAVVNRATIGLRPNNGYSSTISINPGASLVNETNGVLRVEASGVGGSRLISGSVTNRGSLVVLGETLSLQTGPFVNDISGTVIGDGTISYSGFAFLNNGIVSPGASPGILTLAGDYTQTAAGRLNIKINGIAAGTNYDRLAIGGVATLGGTLNIALADNFVPAISNTFRVLTFNSRSGDFATYNGLNVYTNVTLQPNYVPTALDLVAVTNTNQSATPPTIATQPVSQTIINGETASFSVTANGTRPFQYQWFFNNGALGGQNASTLTLANAQTNQSGNYFIIVSNSAGSVTSSVVTLTVRPVSDLIVTDLVHPTNVIAGQPISISWRTLNQGSQTALAPWSESVGVSINSSGTPLTYLGSFAVAQSLASGQSLMRTQTVILPGGLDGNFYVVVTTDTGNQVAEEMNESNNTTISVGTMRVRSPDLQPIAVSSVASAQLGQTIAVSWVLTNRGSAPVLSPWSDRVYLSALSNDVGSAILLGNVSSTNVPFTEATAVTNSSQFTIPVSSSLPPGTYYLVVVADYANVIAETNEANNVRSSSIALTLPPLPDLIANDVSAPSNTLPGAAVLITWSVTNQGSASLTGIWSETIYLATNSAGAGAIELITTLFTNTLSAGSGLERTQQVFVPVASPLGNVWFAVKTDSRDDIFESNETNNFRVATNFTLIPAVLTLSLSAAQVVEGASFTGIITRNGSQSLPLTVTLTNGDPTELSLPNQSVIPAGQASSAFTVTALADGIVDGAQSVNIIAAAPGFTSASAQITVLDGDHPNLTLTLETNSVREGLTLAATVSRDAETNSAVLVSVKSSSPGQLLAPQSVTIPAGEFSVSFALWAVDDLVVEPNTSYTVSVSAGNYNGASASVTVVDDDLPTVSLSFAASSVSESAGPQATIATLTRAPISAAPIYVELQSGDTGSLLVPTLITIPASQASVSFPVATVNNDLLDGPRTVQVRLWVKTSPTGVRVAEGIPDSLIVTDDDGPALRLNFAKTLIAEGLNPATTATVSRNTDTNTALLVNLSSSNTGEATVPASVIIPAGATSMVFNVTTPNDGIADGSKLVTITASATNFASATAQLTVSDVNRPDLVVQSVTAPTSADTESFVSLGYTIRNQGLSAMMSNTIVQRIYLSSDPLVGGDLLMGQYSFSGGLPAGAQFGQTFSVRLPQTPGNFWVIVETDASDAVAEILEDNNTRISAVPIQINAAYDAVVSTTLQSAPANTPVPLIGHAFKPNNAPAPFVLVNIHIYVRGTHRVISALTDSVGNFSTTWQPLPGEAGAYDIGAAHPGYTNAVAQDSFALYGINAVPSAPSLTLMGQGVVTGAVEIVNAGDLPLHAVTAQVINPPANLNFTISFATNFVSGLETNLLSYTITSTDGLAAQGTVVVRITSAEGATLDVPFAVMVKPLVSQLVVTPSPLVRGIKRGVQTFASFTVTNLGGAASGPITISLPPVSWMNLASTNPLPSLQPGEETSVALQLMASADLPLATFTGSILLSAGGNVVAEPFEFRVLSDSKGGLKVTAADEFTYFAAGAPKVTNAFAVLRDAVSGDVITNGVTGTNGEWFVAEVAEGYYDLEVTADKHSAYKGTHLLVAGITNEITAFMQRQTVRYSWTVVPTEVEDRYRIVVNTEFEANVPAPVVTIEPSVIDLADLTDVMQTNLTVINHGLIAAQDFELQFDDHPDVHFEPLISKLGTLPPKSTFTIPLMIRRGGAPGTGISLGAKRAKSAGESIGDCFATGRGIDHFQCGPYFNFQVATISFPNAGGCIRDLISLPAFGWLPSGGSPRPFCIDCGGPPPPRPWTYQYTPVAVGNRFLDLLLAAIYKATPVLAVPNPCDPECLPKLIPVLAKCAHLPEPPEFPPPLSPCEKDLADCAHSILANPGEQATSDCMGGAIDCGFHKGLERFPPLDCLYELLKACTPEEEATATRLSARRKTASFSGPYAGLLGTLQTRVDRMNAVQNHYIYFYGDGAWSESEDQTGVNTFMGQFNAAVSSSSDSGRTVSAGELAGLLAQPLPGGVTATHVNHLVERWNRSLAYWHAGIFTLAQVPPGDSTDFLALDEVARVAGLAAAAIDQTKADGFTSLAAGVNAAFDELAETISAASGGTCAKVSLRLEQSAVVSRDAFNATLEIDNREGQSLNNIYVTLGVFDEAGNDASALFGIRAPELTGISGTNGNGMLANNQLGQVSWTLIPTTDAAPTNDTRYFVSGGLNYIIDGTVVSVPLQPAAITVHPSPRLTLKYFHQRDVFSDDPRTDAIEPAIPFSLAIMVQNKGQGIAKNFRISSAQPEIVDNEKGLLVDFKIIATEVAGKNLQPALTADFGDIGPGTNSIARWLLTSTLQGLFIDYHASFEHVDSLGNSKLSLIDEVTIHEMIHVVQAGGAFEDGRPDFLVNDVPDIRDFPDTLYLSDGSTAHVAVVTNAVINGNVSPFRLQVGLTAAMPGGWAYLHVPDPANGLYRLVGIVRSDNVPIPLDVNAWITDRTFRGLGKEPVRENVFHLLDYNSTGSYTLIYEPNPALDMTTPTSTVAALPANSRANILLHWSGADSGGSGLALFDIYASEDGGAFQRWLAGMSDTSAVFPGTFGKTYAFYSVAVDHAGNREAPPAAPDAVTTVNLTNHAPVITTIPTQIVIEGETLSVALTASDADGDALTFILGENAPPGVLIDSHSGIISWTTGEADGPGTNSIRVIARDTAIPALSATQTFTVIILETNSAPVLAPIADRTISEGQLLTFTNTAFDSDLPAQQLTFSLGLGAPVGATVNPSSGVFTWTPSDTQGGVTNTIAVLVTDNGPSSLSATQKFSIIVRDTRPDFTLSIGTTQVLSGASSSLPFILKSGVDITNINLVLLVAGDRLNSFDVSAVAAEVGAVDWNPINANEINVHFRSQPGAFLQGDFMLAQFNFASVDDNHSGIMSVRGETLSGNSLSMLEPITGAVGQGRIFVIGDEPILDIGRNTNQSLNVTLYARPDRNYGLERRTNFAGITPWQPSGTVNVTELKTILPPWLATDSTGFMRAYVLIGSAGLTIRAEGHNVVIEWPNDCADCVQKTTVLGPQADWQPLGEVPEAVGNRLRVTIPIQPGNQFYRLARPPWPRQ